MSFLQGLLGAVLTGTGQGMEAEEKRKQELADRKAALAEEERRYHQRRKDTISDEDRRFSRERDGAPQYDPATKEMVTRYKDGRVERLPADAAEIQRYEQEQKLFDLEVRSKEGALEQQRALIGMYGRSGGGSGGSSARPQYVTVTNDMVANAIGIAPDDMLTNPAVTNNPAIREFIASAGSAGKLEMSEWQAMVNDLRKAMARPTPTISYPQLTRGMNAIGDRVGTAPAGDR